MIHPLSCPRPLNPFRPTEVVCIWFRTRAAASHPPSSSVFGLACSAWLALCPHCLTSPMETLLKSRSGQEVGGQESFLCTTPRDLERDSEVGGGMRHLLGRVGSVGTLGLDGRSQCPVSRANGSGLGSDLLRREVRIFWSKVPASRVTPSFSLLFPLFPVLCLPLSWRTVDSCPLQLSSPLLEHLVWTAT